MNSLYFFSEGIFPYIAITVFVVGTIYRLWQWLKRPVPLRINLAPAKNTWKGVTGKIAAEVLIFVSLLRSDKQLWVVTWIMHVCGLAVLLGSHTFGLLDAGVEMWTSYTIPAGKTILLVLAAFSFPLMSALLFLLIKRLVTMNVRRITLPADYFALGLVIAHVANGIYMTYYNPPDMVEVVKWSMGLATFQPHIIPGSWIFAVHCLTGFGLFFYFPLSKLFHPLGQITNRWTMTQKEEPLIEKGAVVK